MKRLHVISLGAGVQSTTMALMAAVGEIEPMPDCAIFADTGWEPRAVYEHLERLTDALPFPVHRVSAGNIKDHILRSRDAAGGRVVSAPWFTANSGMMWRQCTKEFKIEPLEKKQRELLGYAPRKRIPSGSMEVWIGISSDEVLRMKPAQNAWQVNRWPLIEKGISRRQCLKWLAAHDWDAPKSSCLGCPYHSDDQWRAIRAVPDEWADVVAVDRSLREGDARGQRHHKFMHRSLQPLDEVDFSTPEERGQLNMFLSECSGLCNV